MKWIDVEDNLIKDGDYYAKVWNEKQQMEVRRIVLYRNGRPVIREQYGDETVLAILDETQPQEDEGKEAIGFLEWAEDKYLRSAENGMWVTFDDHPRRRDPGITFYTTQQLYNIYKTEKNG